jgi:drug/metabolite transporter (DMT)-like permease
VAAKFGYAVGPPAAIGMLAILLALAAAAGYGGSDFAAGLASRKASVLLVTFVATVCALVPTLVVLPWAGTQTLSAAALGWGTAAGLGGMLGALALYVGFRRAAFSVAGPISAVSAAGLSVIVGVLLGERPSLLSLAGIGVALPAIVLVSLTAAPPGPSQPLPGAASDPAVSGPGLPDSELPGAGVPGLGSHPVTHRTWAGVAWGLAAGTGFALLFVGLNRAGSGAGIWPVLSGQAAEVVVLTGLVALTRGFRNRLSGAGGWLSSGVLAVLTGVTGGGATILYFFATHDGFLAITAVLTSLYPAVTIGLARVLVSERLSAARLAGLALAGASVTLIALGGTG